jgi:hypothetical protein|tara:strand:- start:1181 stop:1588 length:408 start_codon:yes stop_codon:yes gene_type:complete
MSAASNYLENKVLDHVLTSTSYSAPGTRYLGLFDNDASTTAANLEAGIITDEISGNGYVRETVAFAGASNGTSSTNATVTFAAATGTWGTITHIAVMDAATNGNVLFWGAVTSSKLIENGDTFQVSSGNLTISLA